MSESKRYRFLFSALLIAALAPALVGQTSEISGRVTDASKAAVGGVKVTLSRADTGFQRAALSSSEGYYRFPLLSAGVYEIRAERDGFQTQTRPGVVVETGIIATVDLQLQVGQVNESVTVTESAPLLDAGSSAITRVVENKTITGMPLLDRRSAQLTRLNGFVVPSGAGAGTTFAIAGGRGNNANYLIGGGTA